MPKKIGLALGSGAAKGLAHIGVLGVLEKEGIPIDMIAGSSAGALIGSLYAKGETVSQITKAATSLGARRLSFLVDPTIPRTGLIRGRKIEEALREIIGEVDFSDLKIPFTCVATDIESGEEIVIKEGPVWSAVRASSSIPILLSVANWQHRYLVDGGLADPVPVDVLKTMGADVIIAVSVTPDTWDKSHPGKGPATEAKEPNIFHVIMQAIHIAGYQAVRASLNGADIIIEPQVAHIGWSDFHRVPECIRKGRAAARSAIPEIKEKLAV